MPVRAPSRPCLTVYVSTVAGPSAWQACSGAAQPSIPACSSRLASGVQAAGVVEYTPTEYLLMMPPLAPTRPQLPGALLARCTVSAMACME